ncbi:hypothetical protein GGS21DRAFT_510181 [Xylaria nigripes]|nr:hypothetical protein GGS21DRAFT_510181 [Xylaria nigripes]
MPMPPRSSSILPGRRSEFIHQLSCLTNPVAILTQMDNTKSTPTSTSGSTFAFADLPPEIREMIWKFALPEPRIFKTLVWVSAGLKMSLLNRSEVRMPLAHVCFEARRVVRESGYVLAFRDEDEPDDTGVWFHPRKDWIERSIWGPGDWDTAI